MTAKLLHTARAFTATATSAAAGYPASNVANPRIARPWLATGAGVQSVELDLGASVPVAAIGLTASNAPSVDIYAGNAPAPAALIETLLMPLDEDARRRGSLIGGFGTVRYIRLEFAANIAGVGVAPNLGAAYVFAASMDLPAQPLYGMRVSTEYPQTDVDLPNGAAFAVDRGPSRQVVAMSFGLLAGQFAKSLARHARAGACWLDLDVSNERWLQWPVRHLDPQVVRSYDRVSRQTVAVNLREIA